MTKVILASSSPRRHELLALLGIKHEVIPCKMEEEKIVNDTKHEKSTKRKSTIEEKVINLAYQKVACIQKTLGVRKDTIIIGADTIVLFKEKIIGKPNSKEEALEMLTKLSGNIHQVYTGICIYDYTSDKIYTGIEKTDVSMCLWDEERLKNYINSENVLDKAGAYAIQGIGAAMIDCIDGCFYNVMGMPLSRLVKMLDEMNFSFLK